MQAPRDLSAVGGRALTLAALGREAEATAALQLATEVAPGSAAAWYNFGHTLGTAGRHTESLRAHSAARGLAAAAGRGACACLGQQMARQAAQGWLRAEATLSWRVRACQAGSRSSRSR